MNRNAQLTSPVATLLRIGVLAALALYLVGGVYFSPVGVDAQIASEPGGFRIGERLTYSVSAERLSNIAYAELYTVSRGRIGDKDAVELRSKFKTLDLASATYYLIDETRTTFASPATGLPLHVSVTQNAWGLPKETVTSYIAAPTTHFDLTTMIYRIRQSGGNGSLTMQENDKVYPVTFQAGAAEKHKTEAGEFETTVVSIQSDYFADLGMNEVRLNLSNDDNRVPVLLRFRTSKGLIKASLRSVQMIEPEVITQPTPAPIRTPVPERTPKPVATPTPYVGNQPLPAELAFEIGEKLEYRIMSAGQPVGTMRLSVKERSQVAGIDTLILEATFDDNRGGSPFAAGDFIRAHVDPETLAPRRVEMRFAGALRAHSSIAVFDRQGSAITFGGNNRVEAPVGTHSILSLLYAARSFNLKPSRDLNNPINDTRVAVFWESRPFVFTLRPSAPEVITVDGKQVPAQLVTVSTKNPALDQQGIKLWLGNDETRIPVRFSVGSFQADLVSVTKP